jgi:hypothetical protein
VLRDTLFIREKQGKRRVFAHGSRNARRGPEFWRQRVALVSLAGRNVRGACRWRAEIEFSDNACRAVE